MERFEIEELYKQNGLEDFKLGSVEDLEEVHKIKIEKIEGFATLDDANKMLFKEFLINFLNALGLESRAELTPKFVYYVEEITYLTKEDKSDDYYIIKGTIVNAITKNGDKFKIHEWKDSDYKDFPVLKTETTNYLRFSYKHYEREEWLHVKDPHSWY
jgi:hypothetical protein